MELTSQYKSRQIAAPGNLINFFENCKSYFWLEIKNILELQTDSKIATINGIVN